MILQKRVDPKKPSEHAQKWNEVAELVTEDNKKFSTNEYFINHPEHMLGKPVRDA